MRRASVAAMVLGLWMAGIPLAAVAAAVQGPQMQWQQSGKCNQDAFAKYPDYTPESNVKREAWRRVCLRDAHIAAPDTPLPRTDGADR